MFLLHAADVMPTKKEMVPPFTLHPADGQLLFSYFTWVMRLLPVVRLFNLTFEPFLVYYILQYPTSISPVTVIHTTLHHAGLKKKKGKRKKKDEMNRDEGRKARAREYEITRVMFFFSLE